MLWIIKRGRTHMQGSDQTIQIYKQIDLLQNERQQRDSEQKMGLSVPRNTPMPAMK